MWVVVSGIMMNLMKWAKANLSKKGVGNISFGTQSFMRVF